MQNKSLLFPQNDAEILTFANFCKFLQVFAEKITVCRYAFVQAKKLRLDNVIIEIFYLMAVTSAPLTVAANYFSTTNETR